ncbi:PREDICTED: alpha-soluble NSF attachment protein-like [Amphimedon queenslandica]|uniref:Uncharacterized protein n=1 Tax=Amphimedon queenslandica TaxID=400682 RepID=A0A1X7UNN2_AMPQE|nr:PREDICTED: alpha-soluble NSF attachment protein-like [Amphimedon queenslandica]|eukprot:XP_003387270.3 PREDICTED: alpha-soluble NSF attachment protein-like [Amphimedon queenslandica]
MAENPEPATTAPEESTVPSPQAHTPISEQEKKAAAFMEQAEKKVQSASTFMGKMFGGASKLEDAADLYTRAANQFKVAKSFERSGDAFVAAAQLHIDKLDSRHEAANSYSEAAQVYKKVKPDKAIECYQLSVDIYSDMGRFGLAARYYMNMAEIEEEQTHYDKSIVYYERAADYYRGEDSNASANKCLLKVAHMCATSQNFQKAAELFDEIGKGCLDNGLLKYSAKDYFFKALLCWFCLDRDSVQRKIDEYKAIHPAFDGTRELKLIENLLEAVLDEDTDKFAEHVAEYDSISRLDAWLTAILLHLKKSIDAEPEVN